MKTVAIVGIKTNNVRLAGKNTRLLCGRPLYAYLWDTLGQCRHIDRVVVDSSNPAIRRLAAEWGFETHIRDAALDGPTTSGHDLIAALVGRIKEDAIVQAFVTTPLVTSTTIDRAVGTLRDNANVDSVVPVYALWDRFWYKGAPVAHDPTHLVGTQFMEPIYRETGFYVFRKAAFLREGCRVTARRMFITMPAEEAVDIDVEADFLYAQALLEARRGVSRSPLST